LDLFGDYSITIPTSLSAGLMVVTINYNYAARTAVLSVCR
jgi:hypothetical protein